MKSNLFFLVLFFIIACSSPQKSLDKQNYSKAFKLALNDLRKKNPDAKSKEILIFALREIIKEDRAFVEMVKVSGSVKRQIDGLDVIAILKKQISKADPYTDDYFLEDYFALEEEENVLIQEISGFYAAEGMANLDEYHQTEQKSEARKAFGNLSRSKKYAPLTVELDSMLENSLDLGQVIYTIDVSTLWNISHAWDIERRLDDLGDNDGQFRKVYFEPGSPTEEVDCRIEIDFSRLDIDTRENEEKKEYEERITTTETTTNDDGEEIEVESTTIVNATVFTNQIVKTAAWEIDISVSGTQNCKVQGTRFSEEVVSRIETKRFEGNERALPSNYKDGSDRDLMSDDDMVDELLDKVYYQISRCLF